MPTSMSAPNPSHPSPTDIGARGPASERDTSDVAGHEIPAPGARFRARPAGWVRRAGRSLAVVLAATVPLFASGPADAAGEGAIGEAPAPGAPPSVTAETPYPRSHFALEGQFTGGLAWGPPVVANGNWPAYLLGEVGGSLALGVRSGITTVLANARTHAVFVNNQSEDRTWTSLGFSAAVVVRTTRPIAGGQTLQEGEFGLGAFAAAGSSVVLVGPHTRCRFHVLMQTADRVAVGPTWGAELGFGTDLEVGYGLAATHVGLAVERSVPGRGHLHAEVTFRCLLAGNIPSLGPNFELQFVQDGGGPKR